MNSRKPNSLARVNYALMMAGIVLVPGLLLASMPTITGVDWQRNADGSGLVATIQLSEPCSPDRIRIMLDVDGPERGETRIGADFMVEGPHIYRHAGGGDWSWTALGEAAHVVSSNQIAVRISSFPSGGAVRAVVELTGEDWSTQSRFPAEGTESFIMSELAAESWHALSGRALDPSLVLRQVQPFRTVAGNLGFRVTVAGRPDISRIRLMVDTDGAASGWAEYGIDVMSEGALTFRYPVGETDWRWDGMGEVSATIQSNTIIVVLPDVQVAGDFRWYAESFDPSWTVFGRLPAEGIFSNSMELLPEAAESIEPPAPDLTDLMKYLPVSLSRRMQKEYLDRPWQRSASSRSFPQIVVPGAKKPAVLFMEYVDADSGERQLLKPERVETSGSSTKWTGRIDKEATWFLISTPESAQDMEVVGGVESTGDRCFRLTVGVTYPESIWTWHDDMYFQSRMRDNRNYIHDYASPYGLRQKRSYYPFAVISSSNAMLVAETDGREPRQFQIEAQSGANRLSIHYDMAATPLTGHFPGLASFRARFRAESRTPNDPFRIALQSWYERDPDWWKARSPKHGLWLPFTDINTIAGAEDFHFAFFEKVGPLGHDVDTAHASGVLNFPYTEPWLYWLPLHDPTKWNRDAAVARMKELARIGVGKERDFASSGFLGASRDANQNHRITFLNTPWSNGGRMEVNTDPELPVTAEFPINRAMAEWRYIHEVLQDPRIDGIYLDSMSAMETMDYNPEAMKVADYPATFVMADLKPGLAMPVQAVEFTSALGRYLHDHGKLLMGNFPCWKFPFFMPYIDVPGEETTWYSGNEFTPMSGRELNYRRAISGAKPFGFLQATHFEQLTQSDMEKYFRECLFFAFMPSFFSHDGANDPYWVDAAMYERDRPLFRKYLPLTIRLSEAGWRPVPSAQVTNTAVRIEQFGQTSDEVFFLTVRNMADADVTESLFLSGDAGPRVVVDMFSGRLQEVSAAAREIEQFLTPNDITSLVLVRPSALSAEAARNAHWASNHMIYEAAARNLASRHREQEVRVSGQIRQLAATVGDDPARLQLVIKNNRSRPVSLLEHAGQESRMTIAPRGEQVFSLPPTLPRREEGWLHVTWRMDVDGQVVEMERLLNPMSIEPFLVTAPDTRIQSDDKSVILEYRVISRQSEPSRVTMTWKDGETEQSQSQVVTSDQPAMFQLEIARDERSVRSIRVAITADQGLLREAATYVIFAPRLSHKGMLEGVRVTADSAYSGYTTEVLHDGVVETAGLNWNDAAFASMETTEAHWIRYAFPAPETVSSVTMHWNREGGITYASRCGEIWITPVEGEPRKVGEFSNDSPVAKTIVTFTPVEVRALELRQPPSCGSPERPGLLWLTEVEVE